MEKKKRLTHPLSFQQKKKKEEDKYVMILKKKIRK